MERPVANSERSRAAGRGLGGHRLWLRETVSAGGGAFPSTPLIVAAAVLLVLYFPIVQAGYYRTDDLGRALLGYNELALAGRPLGAFVVWILNAGLPVTDIAPAPQYLSVLVLAAASVAIAGAFRLQSPLAVGLVALAFGGNPYLFENITFRIDSITMALGAFFAVLPLLWTGQRRTWPYFFLTAASLLSALAFYQPTVNCYPVLALFAVLFEYGDDGPAGAARRLGLYLAPWIAALLVYWFAAQFMFYPAGMQYALPTGEIAQYVASKTRMAAPGALGETIWRNLARAYVNIASGWYRTPLGWLWGTTFALAVGAAAWRAVQRRETGLWRKGATALLFAGAAVAILGSVVAVQLPLADPAILPRTLVAWGALLAGSAIAIQKASHRPVRIFGTALLLVQALATFSLSYAYANALADQKRYDERIAGDIAKDIRGLKEGELESIVVSGYLEVGPGARMVLSKYRFARGLIFSELREDNFWASIRLRWAGIDLRYRAMPIEERRRLVCGTAAEIDNRLYSIHRTGKTLLLRFKNDNIVC